MNILRCALWMLLGTVAVIAASGQDRPNVVLIVADDLGYNALGCYGSPFIETPHLDRLAANGQRWTQAYAGMATCAPSRSVLLSGQYTPRTQVWRVVDRHTAADLPHIRYKVPPLQQFLGLEKVTLAEAFQSAGYRTAHFGKWHLGKGPHHPCHQGFDVAIESASKHFGFKTDPALAAPLPADTYVGDFMTDQALAFMADCQSAQEPFFLYLPYYLVHKPLEAKKEWESYYREKIGLRYGEEMITVAAMTSALDASIGRLYAFLKASGSLENTIFVFTSDNGGYRMKEATPDNILNLPLRSYKGQLYEGGIRVPTIFHWPGRIPAGTTSAEILHFVDLYPTLLDLAGLPSPEDYLLDGTSLRPVVCGEVETLGERAVFWFFPKYARYNERSGKWYDEWRNAMVCGRYKLIEYVETDRFELFDLEADPGESHDLSTMRPRLLESLQERLAAAKLRFGAPVPEPNPDFGR